MAGTIDLGQVVGAAVITPAYSQWADRNQPPDSNVQAQLDWAYSVSQDKLSQPHDLWVGNWGAYGSADILVTDMSTYKWLVFVGYSGSQIIPLPVDGDAAVTMAFPALALDASDASLFFLRFVRYGDNLHLGDSRMISVRASDGATFSTVATGNIVYRIQGVK